MKDESDNEGVLVRYLLGQLPDYEQQRIEQRAFDDDEFYRRLLEVEDDLRCAYARGTLPLAQKNLFEKRFLIFADERKRVALARDMIAELRSAAVENWSPASSPDERQTDRSLFSWFFASANPVTRYALAAAVLIVAAGAVWLLFETAQLRREIDVLRAERAAAEQRLEQRTTEERAHAERLDKQLVEERDRRAQLEQELATREERADEQSGRVSAALFLSPGLVRGGGETKRLVLAPRVEEVRLQLELTGDVSIRYRAVVINSEGNEVWTRTALKPRRIGGRPVISFAIPARILAKDDYELRLSGLDNTGQPERTDSYYFTILKK